MLVKSAFKSLSAEDFIDPKRLPLLKQLKVLVYTALHQKEFVELYSKYVEQVGLVDGVLPMLTLLREKGLEFSVISSNSADMILTFFNLHGIVVKAVYTSQRLFGKKKAISQYMREQNCVAGDIVYIGDESRDIEACNRCGVDIIYACWGVGKLEDALGYKVLRVMETPEELSRYLIEELEA